MPNVSLYMSVQDGVSAPLTKMAGNMQNLTKRAQETKTRLDELTKTKGSLTVDIQKAKQALTDAKKGLDDTKESAEALEKAQIRLDTLQQELRSVSKASRQAEKDLQSLQSETQKMENRAGGGLASGGSALGGSTAQGLLSRIAGAGAVSQLGQIASQAASAYVSSAYGSDAAGMLSSVLSGGASGAAIGSMIAPGVGTAIGAGVGALAGGVSGLISQSGSEDEYFKGLVQDTYQSIWNDLNTALESGTATASGRELTGLAFRTLLGGDEQAAADWLSRLQDFASVTPFGFEDLTGMSKTLMSYGIGTGEQLGWMQAIGDAGGALGLSGSDLSTVSAYLGRMSSTGKVSLEYLNPLMERGINAVEYLAENLTENDESGKTYTEADVYDLISKGALSGSDAARVIIESMGNQYGGAMEAMSSTYSGLVSTLEDAQAQLNAAMGQGYTETRKEGLQSEIDYLSGEAGGQLKEMYGYIGQWQADLENKKEEAIRSAMEAVTDTDEYRQAALEENGAKMGELLAKAKTEAEKAYMDTAEYKTLIDTQTGMLNELRDVLSGSYWEAGYDLGQEFTKGLADAMRDQQLSEMEARAAADTAYYLSIDHGGTDAGQGFAAGLSYVPYDNYPARLHEGERVLTAREARSYGSGGTIHITGNNFTVREEADIDRIAEELARKVEEARNLLW